MRLNRIYKRICGSDNYIYSIYKQNKNKKKQEIPTKASASFRLRLYTG